MAEEEEGEVEGGHFVAEETGIAVVGGGVGGMECARILTLRGHSVTLFEKTGALGGVFIAAAAPDFKEKDRQLLAWYRRQLETLGVDVRLNTEAGPETVAGYDEVVVATGAKARKLKLPGLEDPRVMEAIEYLRGVKEAGEKVVVIGGASTASQFQLTSTDDGATWTRARTNIRDVQASTPSLVYDAEKGLVYNYYYERGRKVIKRRVARVDDVWSDPLAWPVGEAVAVGDEERPHDAGNVNAVAVGGRHYLAYYSGTHADTSVYVAEVSP